MEQTSGDAAGRPATLVVVDDNDLNLKLLTVILQRAGYVVRGARNAQEGIAAARAVAPRAVLMDIRLPGMDGLEATRVMKKDPALAPIPVIAVTALAGSEDRAAALAAGCVEFVTKPIDLKALLRVVEAAAGPARS